MLAGFCQIPYQNLDSLFVLQDLLQGMNASNGVIYATHSSLSDKNSCQTALLGVLPSQSIGQNSNLQCKCVCVLTGLDYKVIQNPDVLFTEPSS